MAGSKVGRPTDLNDTLIAEVCKHILAGNFRYVAAGGAGIPAATFNEWIRRGKNEPGSIYARFLESIQKAEKTAEMTAVARASSEDARAAQWWLERKFPERWSRARFMEAEIRRILAEVEKERDRGRGDATPPPA